MGARILIVENDRLFREHLKAALEKAGYETAEASDGMEGLLLNQQIHPDLILLDFVLPGLDSSRFCRYLRQDPGSAQTAVVALSTMPEEELQKLVGAGVDAALTRELPDLVPKLLGVIQRILDIKKTPQSKPAEGSPASQIFKDLIAERSHFVEIMQILPDGVLELDSSQRVLYANPVACTLLGLNEIAVTGQTFPELLEAEVGLRIAERMREAMMGAPASLPEMVRIHEKMVQITLTRASGNSLVALLHDSTGEMLKMDELQQQNQQLQHAKQELERRLSAIQVIQKLSRSVAYPYGYSEILDAILRFVPELIDQEATAALIENSDGTTLHVFFSKDIGLDNFSWIRSRLVEQFFYHTNKDVEHAKMEERMEGTTCSTQPAAPPIASSLFLPLKYEDRITGVIGCFSTNFSEFNYFDQQLLDLFLNLTFNAVVNMRDLIDIERKKIRAMVESMVDGVLMADKNDEIVVMNQAAKKILRVSRREDSISKKYFQETLGFYPFTLTKGLVHKAGLQATIKEEIKVFDKTLHSVVSPVYDIDGNQTGTVVVLRDITEMKETEERKSDFLSVISHELRTPLASIGGSLDLVLDNVVGAINEKQRRYLELAKDSCQKLNVVIDDLLDISKFEKGKMEIHMEPISIIQLVEEVAEKFQPSAMEKDIVIKLEKPSQDAKVYSDYNRLVQVMNNLLSNAIKFTPQQGEIEIRVFLPKVLSPHVGISVKDTGPGIRAEDLERVFDKFEQVRHSETRKIGGTGLGLAISRSIIEAHKGKIWVESKPGEGAKFIFLLPVEKRATVSPEIYADLGEPSEEAEIQAIIIAADADSAYLMKGILLERNCRVTLSYSAQDGFEMIRQKPPQLIIMDLDLDPGSGVQLIDILSHDLETSGIPIIAFSKDEPEQVLPFPNVAHIKKPIEINAFLQALSTALLKIRGGDKRKKILLVDDDESLRMIAREALQYQNYVVIEASDGNQALELLRVHKPDLVLLDIMLPGVDGLKIAQIVKSNISTSHIPVIFLTAKGQTEDKVRALKSGGDDYLVKPFDSTELAARIEAILERTEKELSASPTTKLPGSVTIEKEINQLLQTQTKFALCYLDVDNLKSYNDAYGYAKADHVIKQTGEIIRETVLKLGHPTDFVGHIAGDDFVFITHPDLADSMCLSVVERFDQIIPYFYKQEDRQRGYIETEDRYGVWRKIPLLSVSVVALTNEYNQLTDHVQIATLAADYKRMAKAIAGSVYIRDGQRIPLRTV
ncbi:response regulator [bacterium]|nr:response regulator [bacterium]